MAFDATNQMSGHRERFDTCSRKFASQPDNGRGESEINEILDAINELKKRRKLLSSEKTREIILKKVRIIQKCRRSIPIAKSTCQAKKASSSVKALCCQVWYENSSDSDQESAANGYKTAILTMNKYNEVCSANFL